MTNKKLTILGVLAVVMVVWAMIQSKVAQNVKPQTQGITYLIQGVNPDEIDSISIKSGSDEVVLNRSGSGFVVGSKSNYAATNKSVNSVISECLDVKVKDVVTSDVANHKDLGVDEEGARFVVRFIKADGEEIADVIVGNPKGSGAYVRKVGEDKVYLSEKSPSVRTSATDYMDTNLTSVAKENIEKITVNLPDSSYIIKGEGENGLLENVPEGKKQKDSECSGVLRGLGNLRFKDAMQSSKTSGLTFDHKFTALLNDSTLYTFNIAKKDDKYFAKCTAEFTDTTPVMKEQGVESEEQLKAKEAKLLAKEAALKFAQTHEGWVYEIQSWYAEKLTKSFDSLVEDIEPAKEEGDAQAAETVNP